MGRFRRFNLVNNGFAMSSLRCSDCSVDANNIRWLYLQRRLWSRTFKEAKDLVPWTSEAKRSDFMSDQEVDGWADACVKAGAKYVKIIVSDD